MKPASRVQHNKEMNKACGFHGGEAQYSNYEILFIGFFCNKISFSVSHYNNHRKKIE